MSKKWVILLFVLLLTQQGCIGSLLSLPIHIMDGTLGAVGQMFTVLHKIPKPPMFLF